MKTRHGFCYNIGMKDVVEISKYLKSYSTRTSAGNLQGELLRKALHLLIALVPSLAAYNRNLTAFLLSSGIMIYTLCETLRLEGWNIPIISYITEKASRKRDQGKFVLGPVTLGIGALLALVFYPAPSAALAIYALAFGDGIASLVGKRFGKIRPHWLMGKSVEGSFACFSIIWLIALLSGFSFFIAVIIASFVTFVEALPLKDMDNIVIPVSTGIVVEIIRFSSLV